MYFINLIARE